MSVDSTHKTWRQGDQWGVYLRSVEVQPPPEWVPGPPDFIGIGTQKAGTTWWYRMIEAHPKFVSRHMQKERHYFTRFGHRPFTELDALRYTELFYRPPGDGLVTGEWTPGYCCEYWVAPIMAEAAPNAKLIMLLREPIARYLSGVQHGLYVEEMKLKSAQIDAYERGRYFSQLMPFLEFYSPENILLLQMENCIADPLGQMRRTHEFLGLEPHDYEPLNVKVRFNESKGPRFKAPDRVIDQLVHLYEPEVAQLKATWPELDLDVWPRFNK